ncbi:hemerythrin domain-containing protein [Roseateles sp.]|uniref:hemerythrin domain-containing protein n=1 Tax=Roseateles sp. TaxID=1971397 RepID=UPI003949F697
MTTKQLYAGPGVGFEAPFEMLAACHGRVRRTLDTLLRLQAHARAHGADEQARQAAADVARYFDVAAPAHHQDEELHIVPRLRAAGRGDLADQLLSDHATLSAEWQALRVQLQALAAGQAFRLERDACLRFARLYEAHAALEDEVIFPLASLGLTPTEILSMGEEMSTRRGASRAPAELVPR